MTEEIQLTEEQVMLAGAKHTNGDYYIGVVVPSAMLAMEIPQGLDDRGWDVETIPSEEEDGEPTYRQKTFGECFRFRWLCADGENVLALLRAVPAPTVRAKRQSEREITMLIDGLAAVGIPKESLIVGFSAVKQAQIDYCTPKEEADEPEV